MKKNISLILCLSFFLSVMNGQISFIQDHITKWTNGLKYTEDVMNTLPDSLWHFKPVKEEMSFREQVLHITQNMYWLSITLFFVNLLFLSLGAMLYIYAT